MNNQTITVKIHSAKKIISTLNVTKTPDQPVIIQAKKNVNYELIDDATQFAPENIKIKRVGNDLYIGFEDSSSDPLDADLIIQDYYGHDGVTSNLLIGLHENGSYYAYVPESGFQEHAVSMLAEEVSAGQALGGEPLVATNYTFNPYWLLALIPLVGLAAAGGGGGGSSSSLDNADAPDVVALAGGVVTAEPGSDNVKQVIVYTNESNQKVTLTATKNSDGTWSLDQTPTGVSINSSTGVVTIGMDAVQDGTEVTSTGTNSSNNTATDRDTSQIDDSTPDAADVPDVMALEGGAVVITPGTDNVKQVIVYLDESGIEVTLTAIKGSDDIWRLDNTPTNVVINQNTGVVVIGTDAVQDGSEVTSTGTDAYNNNASDSDIAKFTDVTEQEGNLAAPEVSLTAIGTIIEGTANDTDVISTASATDEDGDTVTFSITAGTDPNGYYQIDASTGEVRLTTDGAAWVNAGGDLPELSVTGTDGELSDTATTMPAATTDTNDAPEVSLTAIGTIIEGTANDTDVISTASATDEDGDTVTFSITAGTDPNGYYQIDASTGEVRLTTDGAAWVNAGGDLPELSVTGTDGELSDTATTMPAATTDTNDAPEVSLTAIGTIIEGTANDTDVISTASATDEDGDTVTFSITAGTDPNGYYQIDASTGEVRLTTDGAAWVNAGGDLPELSVTGTDGELSDTATTMPAATTDTNDAPEVSLTAIGTIIEGTANDTDVISTASATDEDGDTVTFSITAGTDPNGYYQIDASTGEVRLTTDGAAWVNAGGDLPELSVTGTDGELSDTATTMPAATTDTNDAPEVSLTAIGTIIEGTANDTDVISTASATDEDGDTVTFSITAGTDPNGYYQIDASTGEVRLTTDGAAWVNAGGDLPELSVTGTDGELSDTATTMPAATTDTNDAPEVSLTAIGTIIEGTANDTDVISTASATDEDGDTVTFSITAGTDPNGYYQIDASTGEVRLTTDGAAWVNAGGDLPELSVTGTDGELSDTATTMPAATTDTNDAPEVSLTAIGTIIEGTANDTDVISTASATDEDGDTVTFSITAGTDPNGYYQIDASTGEVRLTTDGAAWVNAGGDLPELSVTGTDGELSDTATTMPAATTDTNDAPEVSLTAIGTIIEGTANDTDVISTASATDEDGDTVTFSITAGTDPNGYYQIDASTGEVRLTTDGAAWVNAGGDLPELSVTGTDGELSDTATTMPAATTDTNDAPEVSLTAIGTIIEGTANDTDVISTASATDEDGDTVTFSITAGTDPNGYYQIDASTGEVRLTTDGAAWVNAGGDLPELSVTGTDGELSDTATTMPAATTDTNDAPEVSLTAIGTIIEGTANDTDVISTASATDEDGDTVTFSITAGTDPNGYYQIDASTGEVRLTTDGAAWVNAGGDLPELSVTGTDGELSDTATTMPAATTDTNDAPEVSLTAIGTIIEGTANDTDVISTASATDEDGDTVTFSITAGTDPNGYYQIDASTGEVRLTTDGAAWVNAGGDLPELSVTGTDGELSDTATTMPAATTDTNDAPEVSLTAIGTIIEGTANDTDVISTASATDEDGDTVTFSITAGTDPNGYYQIDASTGEVRLTTDGAAWVNAGGDLPELSVTGTDGELSDTATTMPAATTDTNDAPEVSLTAIGTIIEGTANDTDVISTASATDEDGDTVTFSITAGTDPNGYYQIDASTGEVRLTTDGAAWVNAGGDLPELSVTGTDGELSDTATTMPAATTDTNDAPEVSLTAIGTIIEGTANDTDVISTASATDEDGDTVTFSITAGTDPNGYYQIDASTGEVRLTTDGAAWVNAGGDLPELSVTGTDGELSDTATTMPAATTDTNDAPEVSLTAIGTIIEGTANDTDVISTASATDEDGDTVTFSITAGTDPNGYYQIDASTGEVRLTTDGAAWVNAGGDLPELSVTGTDGELSDTATTMPAATTDTNDAPEVSLTAIGTIIEGTANDTDVISTASATDEDGDTVTFSITAGTDPNGYYQIDASTGEVRLTTDGAAWVNAGGDLPELSVTGTDGELSDTATTMPAATTDTNDAPEVSLTAIGTIIEGTANDTDVISTASATDEDGDTVTFSITAGTDPNGYYQIDASTGEVRLTTDGAAWVNAGGDLPELSVTGTDGELSDTATTMPAATTDTNDAPEVSLTAIGTIIEGTANDTDVISTASATDEDGDTVTFSITAGTDPNGYYQIDASTGEVRLTTDGAAWVNAGGDLPELSVTGTDGELSDTATTMPAATTDTNDAPEVSLTAIGTIIEGTANDTDVISTASATDEDGDTVTFSITAGTDPNGYYQIDASTGEVRLTTDGAAWVNAGGDLPELSVTGTDGELSDTATTMPAATTDTNDAPEVSLTAIGTIIEGTANDTDVISTASATDEDGDTVTFSITAGTDPNGYYQIDASTGEVRLTTDGAAWVNAGGDLPELSVTGTDGELSDTATTMPAATTDTNDAPEVSLTAIGTIIEGTANDTDVISTASATDEDGDTVTFSITAGTDPNGYYQIDASTGEVRLTTDGAAWVNAGGDLPELSVTGTDGELSDTATTMPAATTDTNDAPEVSLTAIGTIIEGTANDTDVISTASATDEDGDTVTFSITAGTDPNGYYQIDASTGEVRLTTDGAAWVNAGGDLPELSVTGTDGELSDTATTMPAATTDTNDAPEVSLTAIGTIIEGTANDTDVISTASATDEDGDTVTFSITAGTDPNGYYQIDASTGEVRLTTDGAAWVNAGGDLPELSVTGTDGELSDTATTMPAATTDTNDAPEVSLTAIGTIIEGTANDTDVISTASATDEDGDTVTFSITAGTDPNGYYQIDASTGEVRLTTDGAAWVNAGGDLPELSVTGTDGELSDTATTMPAATTDTNDAPEVSLTAIGTIIEGTANDTDVISTASATDEDGDTVTFSITAGTDPNGYYQIDASTGEVRLTTDGAAWVNAGGDLPELSVTGTDGELSDTATTMPAATTDTNDAPEVSLTAIGTIIEGTANDTDVISTASATDEDGDTVTFSITAGTDPNGYYQIDASTGEVRLTTDGAAWVNAGGDLPELSVTGTDGELSDTATTMPAATTDTNDAPEVSLTAIGTIIEGTANDTDVISTASATDEDGDTVTFSITAGTDPNGYYQIDASTGEVRLTTDGAAWVNAGGDLPELSVTGTDGELSDTATTMPAATTDTNDAPEVSLTAIGTIIEGTANDTDVISTASATDEDGDTVTFSITAGTDPNGYYQIDASTGEVRLTTDGAAWVNAGGDLPELSVTGTDGELSDTATTMPAATTDTNDAPEVSLTAIGTIIEGTANDTDVISTASATDEDGDTVTFSITAGTDPNGYYQIDASTGEVRLTTDGAAWVNAGGDLPELSVTGTDGELSDTATTMPAATTERILDEAELTTLSTVELINHLNGTYTDLKLVSPAISISSQGNPVIWTLSADGKTLTGATMQQDVLRVTLSGSSNAWSYKVELLNSIDHLIPTDAIKNLLFTLQDGGSTVLENISVDIVDDVPILAENVSYDFGSTPSIYFGNAVETFGADGGHLSTVTINGVTYTYDSVTDSISFAGTTTQFDPDSYSYENGVLTLITYLGDAITVNFQTGDYSVESTGVGIEPAPDQVAPTAMIADQGGLLGTVGLNGLGLIDLTANQKFTVADADNDITSTSLGLTTNLGDALVNALDIDTGIPNLLTPDLTDTIVLPLGEAIDLIGLDAVLNLLGGTVGGLLSTLGLASYGLEASQSLAAELGLKIIIGDQAFMPNPDGSGDYVYGQTITFELLDPSKPVSSQAFNELLASITVDQAFLGDVADLSLAPTYTLNVTDSLSQTDMAQSIDIANVSLLGNLLGLNTTGFLTEGTAADESIDKSSTTTSQRIYGYEDNDNLTGGSGNDLIRGGTGNDRIIAGNGNDLIYGGSGNDTLTGNDGTDVFVWEDGDQGTTTIPAVDRITDFNQASAAIGGDVLDLSALLAGAGKIGNLAGNLANYLHFETVAGQTEIWISTSGAFTGGDNSAQDSSNIDQKIILEGVNYSANTRTDAEIINELLAKGKLIVDNLYGTPATKESITIDFTAIDNDSDVATKQSDGTATSTGSFDSIAVQPESDLVDPAINTDPVAIFADRALLGLVGLGALGIDLDRQVYAAYDAENNIQKVEITYRPLIEVGLTKISIDASQRLAQELGLKLSYASTEGTLTVIGYSYTLTVTALDGGPIDNVKLNELLATVELTNENGTLLESSTLSLEVLQSMSLTVTDTNGKVDTDLGGSLLDANLINNLGDFNQFIIEGTNIDNTLDASGKLTGQRIYAYDGVDTITGSTHDDWIRAGAGVDTVNAGSGNDAIFGGLGNDILNGQDGNDLLFGESGNDTITGGIGSDIAVFQVLDGEERDATGGNGTDTWTDFIVDNTANPEADMIDISDLLVDYAGDGSAASLADYLSVTSDGTDTTISIDRDGTGSQYQSADILVLRGVDTSLTELVNNNQFII